MATAAALDEVSTMERTVCHEHFTLPKLLPCGHLLCRHCLVSWLKSQPEAKCPLCRWAIVDPKERKARSLEDIPDGFPTDLAMAALVEADHLLSKQHVCCVCVSVAAVSMCLNCGDMLCQSCTEAHRKLSVSKHHKVENLTSLTVEKLAASRPATCGVHDDEISKVYCPTHVGHNPTQDVTMATAAALDEASNMECTVCHEHFTLPKLLPCGHLLCRHCLVSWLKSQPETKCPLCRCAIVDPKERKSRSLEDIADGFPTDLAMAALVEADRLLSKQHVCCVCVNVMAVSMCLNCGDMLCQSCTEAHRKLSMSKHHKVENLTSLTVEKLAASRPATCGVHDDEISKVYCPTHGASICLLCATTDHRQCPDVTKLEKRMEQARAELAKLVAMLRAGETELERAISQLDQQLQDLDKRTQTAVAEIEATADRLESAVKAWRRRLKELAMSTCSDAKTTVLDRKSLLLQRRGRLTSHKYVTQRVQGFSTHGSVCDMTAMMKTRVYDLDCSAVLPTGVKVVSTLTLTIDPQALSRIEEELAHLGQFSVSPVAPSSQAISLRFHDNCGKKIKLSNNNQTAQRTSLDSLDGIVMSRDPMLTNMLYQVRIDERNTCFWRGATWLGVVTSSPDTVSLPQHFRRPPPYVLCVGPFVRFVFGQEIMENRPVLRDLPVGSHLGLALNSDRGLHLYVDGTDQGVIGTDVPDPCYFMFDLCGYCTKVTAVEVKPIC